MRKITLGLVFAVAIGMASSFAVVAQAHEKGENHNLNGHEAGDCGVYGYWSQDQHKCLDARYYPPGN